MKLLSIDIETSPHLVYTFKLWGNNVYISPENVVKQSEMMCFAAKWIGEDEVTFRSTFHDGAMAMHQEVWDLMNEADALVHFNGNRFDTPKIQRELLVAGFDPPSPFKQVDLYSVVKARFDFPYKRLNEVAKALGIGTKVKHSGIDLWKRCLDNDPDAWAEMREYNIQDTILNEELFHVLKPWITNIPSAGVETGTDVCTCGSTNMTKEGFAYTKTGRFQRFRCASCGTWLRSTRRDAGTRITTEVR